MTPIRAAAALGLAVALVAAAPQPCDRLCLSTLADRTVDAIASKRAAALPWARTVRFADNGVAMMVGDGLWGSADGHGPTGVRVADPTTGQAAWFGRVDDHGQPAFLALLLRADGGKIADLETLVRRKEGRPPFGDPVTYAFDPAYAARETRPTSRERIAGLIEGYYNSMAANDGTLLTRFAPECSASENGVAGGALAGLAQGCEPQMKAGLFRAVARVRDRRIVAIDEERGVAVATGFADYPAREQRLTTTDGRPFAAPALYPHSLAFATLFKIRDGAILRVDAITNEMPFGMARPWRDR